MTAVLGARDVTQSAHLLFASSAFPAEPGEDDATNSGIFGRALARWLAERLRERGIPAGEVFAEDFGWVFAVESQPNALYVVCASSGEGPDHWRAFAFTERGFMARLLGKKDTRPEALADIFKAIRHVVETVPGLRDLSEEEAG